MRDYYKIDTNMRGVSETDPTERQFGFNFKLYKSLIIHDYKKRAIQKERP